MRVTAFQPKFTGDDRFQRYFLGPAGGGFKCGLPAAATGFSFEHRKISEIVKNAESAFQTPQNYASRG
jgi:hypothetical protein